MAECHSLNVVTNGIIHGLTMPLRVTIMNFSRSCTIADELTESIERAILSLFMETESRVA